MTSRNPVRVLVLCDSRKSHANTVLDHIGAFRRYSRHDVSTFNPVGMRDSVALDLDSFDVVVVHYSLVLPLDAYVSTAFRDKLRRFRGLKVQFIQDEYRWVDEETAAVRDVGIDILFTCAPEPAAGLLYDTRLPGVRRVETLTGYVPAELEKRPLRPHDERPLDVAYRGRDLPYWLGRLTQEKTWIAVGFLERSAKYGLRTDIGWRERDRMYGDRWIDFISSSRATLGTESGASIADFDGSVERSVKDYLALHSGAPFDEVHDRVLRPYEGNVVVNVISPRVFEAAALGTALVMFPGTYSGIISPGDHYIALQKDFSNMDDVVEQLKDRTGLWRLVERTQQDLVASRRWSYESFIRTFDEVIEEEASFASRGSAGTQLRLARAERLLRVPPLSTRLMRGVSRITLMLVGRDVPRGGSQLGDMASKGVLAIRALSRDPSLRALYRHGRRAGFSRGRLLKEILRFYVLRGIAVGELRPSPEFWLVPEYDPAAQSVRFVSLSSAPATAPRTSRQRQPADAITRVSWDHRAVGSTVRLRKPPIEFAVGERGLESFTLISEMGRRDSRLLADALSFVAEVNSTPPIAVG